MGYLKSNGSGHILRASAIIGSGSVVQIITGMIKTKIIAVILGPAGIGLLGLFNSIQDTSTTIAGLGLSRSGVREFAEAHADSEEFRLSSTRKVLSMASLGLGLFGALFMVAIRDPIAKLAMGSDSYGRAVAWIGIGVLAATVSGSQTAFLNGLRRIGDLARVSIIGALVAMLVAVLGVWLWGMDGIIVAVVSAPLTSLGTSWWFSHKIKTIEVKLSLRIFWESLSKIFNLGFVFMVTALMGFGAQLVTRIVVTRILGLNATGHFQAAWNISMLYLGFVLGAMGTDYYPRLTAVAKDRDATNQMVNEQAEIALLLAGPVVLGMLTLAPYVIALLYSGDFHDTVAVLRWQVFGDLFKVATWPIAFILLAQSRSSIFFFSELFWHVVYLAIVWHGLKIWGLEATGIAFLISYIMYFFLIWWIGYRLTHFSWTKINKRLLVGMILCGGAIFSSSYLSEKITITFGIALTVVIGAFSLFRIVKSLGWKLWK